MKMYYVYVLSSLKKSRLYIGFSSDLRRRVQYHNTGLVKSTKPFMPWRLVYYEAYLNKADATQREKRLKMHKPKSDLKENIKRSLE